MPALFAGTLPWLTSVDVALRDRVARTLGPIVRYATGAQTGQLVAPDVEAWLTATL